MSTRAFVRRSSLTTILAALVGASWVVARETVDPPPHAPATADWNAGQGRLSLRYHGTVVLDAVVVARDKDGNETRGGITMQPTVTTGEKVEQRLAFSLARPGDGVELVVRGTVVGSGEAFPAETLCEAQKRFPYVRNSVGLSNNLRNNAVYDRRWDWVLTGPADGQTRITPRREENPQRVFSWESRGSSLELVFRPRFYQKHKALEHFTPWTYKAWKGSLTGYCTWWAYKTGFTQKTLDSLVDVFAEKHLPDFGYSYIQFDNCFNTLNGAPEGFLNWNNKFPGGPEYAIKRIRDGGMKPGIWVHRVFRTNDPVVKDIVAKHPDWFVHKADGKLSVDRGFYSLDTRNKAAVDRMIRPLYRGLKEQGWDYVKIDGAGDLTNNYSKCAEWFEKRKTTPGELIRLWDQTAREELGPDVYILSCWGVQPAVPLIGVVDGCRLWRDGFGTAEFQRFNSWNGVVWRNDPDHCDVLGKYGMDADAMMPVFGATEPAPVGTIMRPALCSLAGGVLMVSDKVEDYKDDRNLEGMKRSAPVLFTLPGQLYDYSQRGPGQYHMPHCGGEAPWWLLEIDREFDHWSVLARFQWGEQKKAHEWELQGAPEQEIKFADLGLPDDREYLVFEFWSQKFLGKAKGSFTAPAQDRNTGLHVFAIREARAHPWVISTTRHISQGGVSLLDVKWDGDSNALSGKSSVVIGDPYVLTVHLPKGFRLERAEVVGEKVDCASQKETAAVRIAPSATKTVEWKMTFAK
ncbi:MAG TPA: alpha-galactosidase [Planctomycetota bacterium]|nr:alpha-galactosidase [Planctomycetota bacterium]